MTPPITHHHVRRALERGIWPQKGPSKRLEGAVFGLLVQWIKVLPWSDPDQADQRGTLVEPASKLTPL
jgi:hypothetical protein